MPKLLSIRTLTLFLVVCWMLAPNAVARVEDPKPTEHPFLWMLESDDAKVPSFLYGTIHVPDPRVLALPEIVTSAIDSCDALYTELPMEMGAQMSGMSRMMLPGMKTLRDVLPEELYGRLDAYLRARGMSLAPFGKFKVWAVTMQLGLLDVLREFPGELPLDMVIYNRAKGDGKEVGGLETMDEQLDVFDKMSEDDQVRYLELTLDQLDAQPEGLPMIEQMIRSYLAGSVSSLNEMLDEMPGSEEDFGGPLMERLLDDRNVRMADRIAEKVRANPGRSYFFAVGAGHYLEEGGVGTLLREKGFDVKRIAAPESDSKAPTATPERRRRAI